MSLVFFDRRKEGLGFIPNRMNPTPFLFISEISVDEILKMMSRRLTMN